MFEIVCGCCHCHRLVEVNYLHCRLFEAIKITSKGFVIFLFDGHKAGWVLPLSFVVGELVAEGFAWLHEVVDGMRWEIGVPVKGGFIQCCWKGATHDGVRYPVQRRYAIIALQVIHGIRGPLVLLFEGCLNPAGSGSSMVLAAKGCRVTFLMLSRSLRPSDDKSSKCWFIASISRCEWWGTSCCGCVGLGGSGCSTSFGA